MSDEASRRNLGGQKRGPKTTEEKAKQTMSEINGFEPARFWNLSSNRFRPDASLIFLMHAAEQRSLVPPSGALVLFASCFAREGGKMGFEHRGMNTRGFRRLGELFFRAHPGKEKYSAA